MEAIIQIGCERILTSGQRPTAEEGAPLDEVVAAVERAASGLRSMGVALCGCEAAFVHLFEVLVAVMIGAVLVARQASGGAASGLAHGVPGSDDDVDGAGDGEAGEGAAGEGAAERVVVRAAAESETAGAGPAAGGGLAGGRPRSCEVPT